LVPPNSCTFLTLVLPPELPPTTSTLLLSALFAGTVSSVAV